MQDGELKILKVFLCLPILLPLFLYLFSGLNLNYQDHLNDKVISFIQDFRGVFIFSTGSLVFGGIQYLLFLGYLFFIEKWKTSDFFFKINFIPIYFSIFYITITLPFSLFYFYINVSLVNIDFSREIIFSVVYPFILGFFAFIFSYFYVFLFKFTCFLFCPKINNTLNEIK
jgi:hypothetical protein